jgi:hypothetical protein
MTLKIKALEKTFVESFSKFLKKNVDLNKKIYGVSLLPISTVSGAGSRTIALGVERDGYFTGLYNYFGGKVGDKVENPEEDKSKAVATVLFQEVYEEFGIILTYKLLKKCLLGILENPYMDGASLLFVVHITDVDPEVWKDVMYSRRDDKYLPWNFQEMSKIDNVKVEDIIKYCPYVDDYDPSGKCRYSFYVISTIDAILPFYEMLSRFNRVRFGEFETTQGLKLY